MQTAESNGEGGSTLNLLDDHDSGQKEGECRKDAAHALLEPRRNGLIRRAHQAMLFRLLEVGTATADDVAERIGPTDPSLDPRWLGTVPGPLAIARIIRRVGYTKSARPSRNASVIAIWELADRAAALAWLAHNPDLPETEDGDEVSCPDVIKPPSLALAAAREAQPNLF